MGIRTTGLIKLKGSRINSFKAITPELVEDNKPFLDITETYLDDLERRLYRQIEEYNHHIVSYAPSFENFELYMKKVIENLTSACNYFSATDIEPEKNLEHKVLPLGSKKNRFYFHFMKADVSAYAPPDLPVMNPRNIPLIVALDQEPNTPAISLVDTSLNISYRNKGNTGSPTSMLQIRSLGLLHGNLDKKQVYRFFQAYKILSTFNQHDPEEVRRTLKVLKI